MYKLRGSLIKPVLLLSSQSSPLELRLGCYELSIKSFFLSPFEVIFIVVCIVKLLASIIVKSVKFTTPGSGGNI